MHLHLSTELFVSGNPFINRIPEPMIKDLRADYRRQILKWTNVAESPDPDAGCTLDYKLLCAIAQKPNDKQ